MHNQHVTKKIENPEPVLIDSLNSSDLRALIREADLILGIDPHTKEKAVFHGRDQLEEIIQSQTARQLQTIRLGIELDSEQTHRLYSEVLAVKGTASYSPAERFPEIVIDFTNLPPQYHSALEQIIKAVRLEHLQLLPKAQQMFFHIAKEAGFSEAIELTRTISAQIDEPSAAPSILLSLGELIQERLPADSIIPSRCMDVFFGKPTPHQILIRFRSLLIHGPMENPGYYSHRTPKIVCGNDSVERTVSFCTHALERIHERTVANWRTYSGSGDAFAYVDNCVYYEDCSATMGKPCFALYNECAKGFVSYRFLEELLDDFDPNKKYYYRVGYCPSVLIEDFVLAKTLIVPGMRGTPERRLFEGLPITEQSILAERMEALLTWRDKACSEDWGLLKWFHDNGVPQVISFEQNVFEYD